LRRSVKTRAELAKELDEAIERIEALKRSEVRQKESEALNATRITLLEFAASHTLEELLQKTLDEVGKFTHSPIGFFHFVESDQKTLSLQAWSTRTIKEFCQAKGNGMHYSIENAGVWVDCVRARQPVIHNDYASLPHRKGMPPGHASVVRELVVPVLRKERIVAILGVGNKPDDYTHRDIGLISYLANVAWEITERKQTEEALTASEARYRRLFETAKDGILIIDAETGLIIDVNHFLVILLNRPKEDIVGSELWEIGFFKDIVANKARFKELYNKGYVRYDDLPLRKADGQEAHVEFISNVYNVNHQRVIQCNIRDITERKQAEAEAHHLRKKAEISSRLASVGEMAAGIAHEINNPLTSVLGFSELLLQQQDLPDEIKDQVKYIAEGSNRVKEIVKRLLTFSRQAIPYKTNLDIHELIDTTLALRAYVHKTANIEIVKEYTAGLPWLTVDPSQIQQVIMNIIVNAEYSIKTAHSTGRLIITTKRVNNQVYISFEDNGAGMSEQTLAKLFSPFFTTKDPGEGTGLGLSISRSIILDHGGTLEAESVLGKGAAFIITLPITPQSKEPVPAVETKTSAKKPANLKASVLVVDDEQSIRSLIKNILAKNGHAVEGTGNPGEVMLKLEKSSYDIVLIDIRMPGMSGTDLYTELKTKWPDLARRVIFITGDTSDFVTRKFLEEHNLPYIAKPFDQDALVAKVNELLGS